MSHEASELFLIISAGFILGMYSGIWLINNIWIEKSKSITRHCVRSRFYRVIDVTGIDALDGQIKGIAEGYGR